MKPLILNLGACLLLALGLVITTRAQGEPDKQAAAAHVAAVTRCREQLTADERAAKDKSGAEQAAALKKARKNYDDCIKVASRVH